MNSLSLGLSYPTNLISTRYSDNDQSLNLVINLIFLRYSSEELKNYTIHPKQRLALDHAPLTITISIEKQYILNRKCFIVKGSTEEKEFIKDMIRDITIINTSYLTDIVSLEKAVDSFTKAVKSTWEKNSKIINIRALKELVEH